jgi:hypothetical protein
MTPEDVFIGVCLLAFSVGLWCNRIERKIAALQAALRVEASIRKAPK